MNVQNNGKLHLLLVVLALLLLCLTGVVAADPVIPVADFSATPLLGETPLHVQFTDLSTGPPTSWKWEYRLGSGSWTQFSTVQNASYTFTSVGSYRIRLTATNSLGSNTKTSATGYITVSAAANPDLTITDMRPIGNTSFARESNSVKTTVRNIGGQTSNATTLMLVTSDGFSENATVPSLASNAETIVTIVDTTDRDLAGGSLTYTATVDPDNTVTEASESNNVASNTYTVTYNGYKGKTYWDGGSNVTTKKKFDLHGDLLHSFGDSVYKPGGVGGGAWNSYTVTWTGTDIPVPSGATVREARLYVPYTWDSSSQVPDHFSVTFNGNVLLDDTWYKDESNFGGYDNYYYGLLAYNVTSFFSGSGNSAVVQKDDSGSNLAMYGLTLAVVYEKAAEPRRQIFLNEEFDILGADESGYATTPQEATAYVPFSGMTIVPADAVTANLTTFVPSGNMYEGVLLFNGETIATNVWDYGLASGTQVAVDTRDVKTYLTGTGNEAGIRSTAGSTPLMAASQEFLVVTYEEAAPVAPVANFTANVTNGAAPLTVAFTDKSTHTPTSWNWSFGDGTNSTVQNATHTYTTAGTYTVNLTATNTAGSNTTSKAGFITVTSTGPSLPWQDPCESLDNWTHTNYVLNSATFYEGLRSISCHAAAQTLSAERTIEIPTGAKTLRFDATAVVQYAMSNSAKVYLDGQEKISVPLSGSANWNKYTIDLSGVTPGPHTFKVIVYGEAAWAPIDFYLDNIWVIADDEVLSVINVTPASANVTVGDIRSFSAAASTQYKERLTGTTFSWSSANEAVGTVNATGHFTALGPGTTMVNATAGGVTGSAQVSVTGSSVIVPVANFTANVTSGTAPLTVNFTDESSNTPTSWNWSFGDGGSSPEQSPVHTYSTAGTYTVNLTAANSAGGNTTTKTDYITVTSSAVAPVANFSANTTTGTAPLTLHFTDTSTGSPTSWSWSFGDGTNLTVQNATHTYTSAGNYTINLTATNAVGSDSEVKTDYITVSSGSSGSGGLADSAWPKFHRDSRNTGLSPSNGPQTGNVLWTYTTGNLIFSSPSIGSDGTIYIGSTDYKVYAINPNGTLKWSYTTGGEIRGSPAIGSDGIVYIGGYGDKTVYALNPDGTLKWSYTTGGNLFGSPTIGSDGTIYIGSTDYKVYAINPDGTFKWSYTTGHMIRGSPAVGSDGTVYIGGYGDKTVYALNPDGTLKWSYLTGSYIDCSPAIGSDGTVYIGSEDKKLYALNIDGTLKWSYTTGNQVRSTPGIGSDGTIYIGSEDKKLYALNPDGTLKWSYTTGGMVDASSAIGSDGTIYFGSYDQNVYALNPNGTLKWSYTTVEKILGDSSPAIGSDGTLYLGNRAGIVYAFKDVAPVALFTATPRSGDAPLKVQFTDASTNTPTSWAWDFDNDNLVDSTTRNPFYTYVTPGTYTVNLTVTNAVGSDSEILAAYITVTTPVVPVAGFSTNVTSGNAPLTVTFNDTSTNNPTSWLWTFGDGTNSTVRNSTHTYTTAGTYTVNLTTTNAAGSDSEVKTNLITVNGASDLIVSSVSPLYPLTHNTVTATIKNVGTDAAGAFKANITVDGNTASSEIASLAPGNTTTISITDNVFRKYGDSVPITVTVDTEDAVTETNETNNVFSTTATITTNGNYYTGGRSYSGIDLETGAFVEGNVALVYSLGNSGYQSGGGWSSTTVQYTGSDLPIPANATIKEARLYQSYTWCNYGNPGFTLQFNGNTVNQTAFYADPVKDGDGAGYGFNGQAVYDVTPYFNKTGNTAVVYASSPNGGLYGAVLAVVYEDTNNPYRMIWLDEGCDSLYGGSDDSYVGYAIFNNVTTSNLVSAKVATILPSGNDNGQGTISFNNQSVATTGAGGGDPSFRYYNVTSALLNGTNEVGVRCDGYMNLAAAFLEVTKETASDADFVANATSGETLFVVRFTDTSTGTPTGWLWNFGDGATSAEQNPVHIYTTAGTYTVNLTITNSLGTDTEGKQDYITVTSGIPAPVADFTAIPTTGIAPLTVRFTDNSTSIPSSWTWNFGDGDSTNASEQNPVHTYASAGTYSVTLTAANSGGSNSTTKTGYITAISTESPPVASFTTDATSGRVPFTVHFTDTTSGSVNSQHWLFGDGSTSTERNPTHTYIAAASCTVTLTATGPGGSNTTTQPNAITVTAPLTSPNYNGGIPLTTMQNGTVSGGLWYDAYPGFATSAQKTFTLPGYTDIKWARLYTVVYCGHMNNNYRGTATIGIDANGDSTYEIQKAETFNSTYTFPGLGGSGPIWLSDHMNRVTSDYLMWYDLTDAITGQTVKVQVTTADIDSSFDGRVKAIVLVVAYDDGDTDKVQYWVNQGHDTVNKDDTTYTGSTVFGTNTLTTGWSTANLTAIYLASEDGAYTFLGDTIPSGTPSGEYFGTNTWDVGSKLTAGEESDMGFTRTGQYYKIPLALMSIRYAGAGPSVPVANFTANTTSGPGPLSVQFTDQSTNTPTSWNWSFGDGTNATAQNATHTYTTAGTYTVNLTATNTAGSNTTKKAGFITVTSTGPSLPWQDPCESLDNWTHTNYVLNSATFYEGLHSISCHAAAQTLSAERTIEIPAGAKTLRFDATAVVQYAMSNSAKVYLDGQEKISVPLSGSANWNKYTIDLSGVTPGPHTFKVTVYGEAAWAPIDFYLDNIWVIADDEVLSVINVTPASANVTVGDVVAFSAAASTQYKERLTATTFSWSSVNGAVGTVNATGHFTALGAGTTMVNATAGGVTGTAQVSVTGSSVIVPVANFTANVTTGTAPLTVKFTDQSANTPTSWSWSFGDGGSSPEQSPVHTYTTAGTYMVNLTATNSAGSNTTSKTNYITVNSGVTAPVAAFSVNTTSGTAPLAVKFTDQSTNTPTSWKWEYKTGAGSWTQFSTDRNATYTFAEGTYDIRLNVTNAGGSDTKTETAYITAGAPSIEVGVGSAAVTFGTMSTSAPSTGSTQVNVTTSGGTAWSITAADSKTTNKGYMATTTGTKLASPFQLSNGGAFQDLTADFTSFMSGSGVGTTSKNADVKQVIAVADAAGDYAITVTFTGAFV